MPVLRTIHLHGVLGEKYGTDHQFALNSPREAISALDANFPGFRADYFKFPFYGLVADGDNRTEANCPDVADAPFSRDLHLVPMVEGRLTGLLLPVLGLIGLTGIPAQLLAGALTIGLLFGISMLLAPKPPDEEEERDENYAFTGPENVAQQGAAVPLIYGRCFVGSVVVSSGIETARGAGLEQGEGRNYMWRTSGTLMAEAAVEPPAPLVRHDLKPYGRTTPWRPVNG